MMKSKIIILCLLTFLIAVVALAGRSAVIFSEGNVKALPTGDYVKADGTVVGSGSGGSGNVVGPASSTDRAVSIFNGITGKTLQNSSVLINANNRIVLLDGSQETPSITFAGTTNGSAGLFLAGSNNVAMTANGGQVCDWSTSRFSCLLPFRVANGDVSAPSISWNGSADTGFYRSSVDDNMAVTVNGVKSMEWDDTEVEVSTLLYVNAASLPSILVMKSPDGTCARCGVSDTDVFSCASTTCP